MRTSRPGSVTKRIVDLGGAAVLLVILSPLLVAIALLVKATSRGAVLFAQERLGMGGKRFLLYKFRTMCPDAEAILRSMPDLHASYVAGGYKLAHRNDPRITRVGHWLRRCGLDELPQLFNVMRGEMSLVGPRPIVPAELQQYPEYLSLVQELRPGITGCWQISRSPSVDYARRGQLERYYATNHSLQLDVSVLAHTFCKLVASPGLARLAFLAVPPVQSQSIATPELPGGTRVSKDD